MFMDEYNFDDIINIFKYFNYIVAVQESQHTTVL